MQAINTNITERDVATEGEADEVADKLLRETAAAVEAVRAQGVLMRGRPATGHTSISGTGDRELGAPAGEQPGAG
ncbi:hypothetical protein AB0D08_38150 [Kitasatospora sp. NPDC048540]|uniref:hypothetical protein n=1 Tax=unclassified Kitasatospora TaxID=2633591 RepID=UPI00053969D5|nr:hypothetical protein [Kitasatospora sp. MBT63]